MSSQKLPYEFRFECEGNFEHIYACFRDHYGGVQEVEIDEELHQELIQLNRSIRNIIRSEERHELNVDRSDEEQAKLGASSVRSAEEVFFDNIRTEEMRDAFKSLPAKQSRRFLLAHVVGLSYVQI
ncbi:MAG: hypothetical protein LBH87_00310, partial [Coriobacteriales bacterium]|nr:hypothetical protein [Coriobacteriales bacterium]